MYLVNRLREVEALNNESPLAGLNNMHNKYKPYFTVRQNSKCTALKVQSKIGSKQTCPEKEERDSVAAVSH